MSAEKGIKVLSINPHVVTCGDGWENARGVPLGEPCVVKDIQGGGARPANPFTSEAFIYDVEVETRPGPVRFESVRCAAGVSEMSFARFGFAMFCESPHWPPEDAKPIPWLRPMTALEVIAYRAKREPRWIPPLVDMRDVRARDR